MRLIDEVMHLAVPILIINRARQVLNATKAAEASRLLIYFASHLVNALTLATRLDLLSQLHGLATYRRGSVR